MRIILFRTYEYLKLYIVLSVFHVLIIFYIYQTLHSFLIDGRWGHLPKDSLDNSWLKIVNLEDFICYEQFTNDYMMCQENQLFRIIIRKTLSFLDYHWQLLAQKVQSYFKYTRHFLK